MKIPNTKYQIPNTRSGFTLVEVIVAMFIFVLVMTSSTVIFGQMFKNYRDAKDIQSNVEDAQYAMNLMAKTFRTSSVAQVSGEDTSVQKVVVFDHSQGECIAYIFDSSDNNLDKYISSDSNLNDCIVAPPDDFISQGTMTSGDVNGNFYVTSSSDDIGNEQVGKITVSMTITKGDSNVNLQTTTSLRDYEESGISL